MATVFQNEFYALLKRVQQSYGPIISRVPDNAVPIDVHLNTRTIDIDENDWLSVETDHRAEVIYLEVDRYYEDVDLLQCTIIIEYINANNDARIYPISLIDTESKPGKMILAWNIGNAATAYAGIITFSLVFYKINNQQIIYKLSTKPARAKIEEGMGFKVFTKPQDSNTDDTLDLWKEQDNYYAMGENYITILGELNTRIQNALTWNNL